MSLKIENLISFISRHPTGCHFNDICVTLQIEHQQRAQIDQWLNQLCHLGLIRKSKPHTFHYVSDQVQGTLSMHPQGFAFIYPELSDEYNLYVDRDDLLGAMHRDRVKVSVHLGPDQRLRGKVVSIMERGTQMCVGIYRTDPQTFTLAGHEVSGYIYPQDERLPTQIPVLTRSVEELKRQDITINDGQWVAILLHEQQQHILAQVLHGIDPSTAQGELEAVIYDQGITLHLDQAVKQEAEKFTEEISVAEKKRRKDVRHLSFVTIDPNTAQDFDDALYAYEREEGGWHLWVAIADVAHYVKAGGLIDVSAQKRGATLYLPAQAFPMLPRHLANHLCSLKPNVERLAMLVHMEVSFQGEIVGTQFFEGIICSQARFTYDEAASLLGILPQQDLPKKLIRMKPQLLALRDCTRALQLRRRKRGFLNLEMIEPRLQFNLRGMVDGFSIYQRHEVHRMVEEAMLAANESVADFCIKKHLSAIYRQHGEPTERGLSRFIMQSKLLGVPLTVKRQVKAVHLSKYLKKHDQHVLKPLLNTLLLRAMAKATYEADPGLHFGLGTTTYLHFTSPIRRYPDLWVHRQLKTYLQRTQTSSSSDGSKEGKATEDHVQEYELEHDKPVDHNIAVADAMLSEETAHEETTHTAKEHQLDHDTSEDETVPHQSAQEIAAYASRRERLLMQAERNVLSAYKALFMKQYLGQVMSAFICQASKKGFRVELNQYPILCTHDMDSLQHTEHLHYDEATFTWYNRQQKQRLALGTQVQVKIVRTEVITGEIYVQLVT